MKYKDIRKIVVIFGSPRKTNSYQATKRFEKELKKLGNYDFEYIHLNEVKLDFCRGCHNCLFLGHDKCSIKDDIGKIVAKMLESDGIVFVSPVYVVNVSGLMKNFIDRICYICHRPALFNQHVMIISTVAAMGNQRVLKYMKEVAEVWGSRTITTLGLVTPPNEEVLNTKNSNMIEKKAILFHSKFGKPLRPLFNQLMQFELFKRIFTSDLGKSVSPADCVFYSKLKESDYMVPAKINLFKKNFAKLSAKVIIKFIK